jgi:hypothetical protein
MTMTKRIATAILTASVAFTVVGCASSGQHESTGQYVDDAAITAKVKAAIFADPGVKSTEVNVETRAPCSCRASWPIRPPPRKPATLHAASRA